VTRVADTSVLYALLSRDDAHHEKAREDVSDPEPIVVPTEILVETVDLVSYRFGKEAGPRALEGLLSLPHVRVAEKVHIDAVQRVYAEAKGRLSLADAFVVQTCRALGARPLSYDDRIVKAAR